MKSHTIIFSTLMLLLPMITFAEGIQGYIGSILTFINTVVMPFILGIAFLIFTVNAIRFFVLEGSNEDGRENAKALALYSVMAFVIIIIFWGVINVLSDGTGLAGEAAPTSDYIERGGPGSPTLSAPFDSSFSAWQPNVGNPGGTSGGNP